MRSQWAGAQVWGKWQGQICVEVEVWKVGVGWCHDTSEPGKRGWQPGPAWCPWRVISGQILGMVEGGATGFAGGNRARAETLWQGLCEE